MCTEERQGCTGTKVGAVSCGEASREDCHNAKESPAANSQGHAAPRNQPLTQRQAGHHDDACPAAAVPGGHEAGQEPAWQVSARDLVEAYTAFAHLQEVGIDHSACRRFTVAWLAPVKCIADLWRNVLLGESASDGSRSEMLTSFGSMQGQQ